MEDERIQAAVKVIAEHDPIPTVQALARSLLGLESVSGSPVVETHAGQTGEAVRLNQPTPPLSEAEIQQILSGLKSLDPYQRLAAIRMTGSSTPRDERLTEALRLMAEKDGVGLIRNSARQALAGNIIPLKLSKPSAYITGDFWIGFLGFFITNGLLYGLYQWLASTRPYQSGGNFTTNYLPTIVLFLNIAAPIGLGIARKDTIVVGIGAAWAVPLAFLVCISAAAMVVCWLQMGCM